MGSGIRCSSQGSGGRGGASQEDRPAVVDAPPVAWVQEGAWRRCSWRCPGVRPCRGAVGTNSSGAVLRWRGRRSRVLLSLKSSDPSSSGDEERSLLRSANHHGLALLLLLILYFFYCLLMAAADLLYSSLSFSSPPWRLPHPIPPGALLFLASLDLISNTVIRWFLQICATRSVFCCSPCRPAGRFDPRAGMSLVLATIGRWHCFQPALPRRRHGPCSGGRNLPSMLPVPECPISLYIQPHHQTSGCWIKLQIGSGSDS